MKPGQAGNKAILWSRSLLSSLAIAREGRCIFRAGKAALGVKQGRQPERKAGNELWKSIF